MQDFHDVIRDPVEDEVIPNRTSTNAAWLIAPNQRKCARNLRKLQASFAKQRCECGGALRIVGCNPIRNGLEVSHG